MRAEDLENLNNNGAVLDMDNKRVEISKTDANGTESKVVCYFPSEHLQVIAYDIHSSNYPELGLQFGGEGRYLRINCCKKGSCQFKRKDGKFAYLSSGEISMDYNLNDDGTFSFTSDNYLGVEIIMQVDDVIVEIPALAMLKKAIKRMVLPDYSTNINSLYFVNASKNTKQVLDTLLDYCFQGEDYEAIVIKISELGYNIGLDLQRTDSKLRLFATRLQTRIAEDIYNKLTFECDKKWTASMFSEKYKLSESTVKNYFRNVYGYTFKEYQIKARMDKAADLLVNTKLSVGEISLKVGYLSGDNFRAVFKNYHGVSPLEYRMNKKIESSEN